MEKSKSVIKKNLNNLSKQLYVKEKGALSNGGNLQLIN